MPSASKLLKQTGAPALPVSPWDIGMLYGGVEVPDPITFVVGERWLNRPNLYPRQATLLKVIFLRLDLLTEYDHMVIDEWEEQFRLANGKEGLAPGVRNKMALLRGMGYKWFREVLLVMGRRAGKGHVTALAMTYVLWNYMAKGDPQGFYGVDRDKQLVSLIFAGKRDQAKATVFGDLVNVITGSTCFAPFLGSVLNEKISVYAPNDFLRMRKLAQRGVSVDRDMATFAIQPRESTMMAGRGPTSFQQCLDPETPVLTTDLTWVPIKDIKVGDELVGIDEYPEKGVQRAMRRSRVEAVWKTHKSALRLTFDDGSSVVCSSDHQWLGADRGKSGNYRWYKAGAMRVGYQIRRLVNPWEEDTSYGAGYLSRFFDGEGCIVTTGNRRVCDVLWSQNPGPVLDHVNDLLAERGFTPRLNRDPEFRKCQSYALRGDMDNLRFLGQIRPHRLLPKASYVWEGRRPSNGRLGQPITKTIIAIEPLPEQDLIDITTSTRTFVANGLFTHNCYDEAGHIVASGANRSAQEVYDAAKPSLDQFGKDAFIMHPSSPWQMVGMFYDNWLRANEVDENGEFVYPDMLSLQLASWDIYLDWEQTIGGRMALFPVGFPGDLHEYIDEDGNRVKVSPTFVALKGAIQVYDDQMRREERANPDTFKVERRAQWAAALDAYLNENKVAQIFKPWLGRPEKYGPPELQRQARGIMAHTYKGHADPSKVNDKFGIAVAHTEYGEDGTAHCVFDLLYHFDPQDFPDGIIDYEEVDDWLWENVVVAFMPDEFTFDQYNSTSSIQKLQKKVRAASLPKRVQIFEKTATRPYDWQVKENSKAAINLNLVHCFSSEDDPHAERAELELKFLQEVNGRVDHQSSGPVQSKDIADAMTECIHVLIGEQVQNFLHTDLSNFRPGAAMPGGIDPFAAMRQGGAEGIPRNDEERISALSAFGAARGRPEYTPSRNPSRRQRR